MKPILIGQPQHYLLQVAISGGSSFLFVWLATIKVGNQEFGNYLLLFSYAIVAAGILNLGLVFGYERGFFEYDDNEHKQNRLFSSLFYFSSVIFFVFWLLVNIFAEQGVFGTGSGVSDFLFLYSGACVYILQQYFTTHFRCGGESGKFLIFASFPQILLVVILYFLKTSPNGVDILAFVYFLAQSLSFFIVLVINKNIFVIPKTTDVWLLVKVVRISLPMTPRVVLGLLANQIDKIFVGELIGPVVLATYGVAQSIAISVFQFMSALGRTFQPVVYKVCFGKLENVGLVNLLIPHLRLSMVFSVAVSIAAHYVIKIGFDSSYEGVPHVVNALVIGYLLLFPGKVSGIQLAVSKNLVYSVIGTLILIGINVSTITFFYETFSLIGLAFSFIIAQFLSVTFMYFAAQRCLPIDYPLKEVIVNYAVFLLAFLPLIFFMSNLSISLRPWFDVLTISLLFFYSYKSGIINLLKN